MLGLTCRQDLQCGKVQSWADPHQPGRVIVEYAPCFEFKILNNEKKYEVLIIGLKITKGLGVQYLKVYSDSQSIIDQIRGEYEAHEPSMVKYLQKVKNLSLAFVTPNIQQM